MLNLKKSKLNALQSKMIVLLSVINSNAINNRLGKKNV